MYGRSIVSSYKFLWNVLCAFHLWSTKKLWFNLNAKSVIYKGQVIKKKNYLLQILVKFILILLTQIDNAWIWTIQKWITNIDSWLPSQLQRSSVTLALLLKSAFLNPHETFFSKLDCLRINEDIYICIEVRKTVKKCLKWIKGISLKSTSWSYLICKGSVEKEEGKMV